MIDNSWSWAKQNGKLRTNPVHKREEARLVLDDWFEHEKKEGQSRTFEGTATIEDRFSFG